MFGASDEFSEYSKAPSNEHQKQYAAFAQDEWKATPRLTLTYGLRYEYTSPETDTHGYSFSIVPGVQSVKFPGAPLGFLVPGDPGAPRGWYFPDHTNFSPRIGIAWDPFGDGKTSIRGGGGLFFDTLNGWMSDWATDEAPWAGGTDFTFDPTHSSRERGRSNTLPPLRDRWPSRSLPFADTSAFERQFCECRVHPVSGIRQ